MIKEVRESNNPYFTLFENRREENVKTAMPKIIIAITCLCKMSIDEPFIMIPRTMVM